MESVSRIKNLEINPKINSGSKSNCSFEVVVIEDNHLTNTILSKALDSTIKTIQNIKNIAVTFLSFHNGNDFLDYLKNKEFVDTQLIVFSDYHLEDNMNGGEILLNVKQRISDAIVLILSDTTNKQISIDTMKMGAYCFLPKDSKTPVICSELLYHMLV